uniref:Uncharacterized protein n=1 Tax=Lepeophtheirus salmonis TaxID=72036 RepID=A0A0K2UU45_LEPSM
MILHVDHSKLSNDLHDSLPIDSH